VRLCAVVLLVAQAFAALAQAGLGSTISFRGTVLASDPAVSSLQIADATGDVHAVFVDRQLTPGTTVFVRGSILGSDRYTVFARSPRGSVRRLGRATSAVVLGQIGFVDIALNRFQLAAHGQIVGYVSYRQRLEPILLRLARQPGLKPHRLRVGFARARLVLLALPL
jgi:hypothetical protein